MTIIPTIHNNINDSNGNADNDSNNNDTDINNSNGNVDSQFAKPLRFHNVSVLRNFTWLQLAPTL